ncbi:uncharacterized protein LOC130684376 [Manis pentadactyla]|uniref:uncharacterized protein LOC130684376 n=1 Tax=Manis pentadactyla TaxID=143292 RepID=UPI00255C8B28|nr:uncharacterized protein LOC130684376 [Manis pentadactyla]
MRSSLRKVVLLGLRGEAAGEEPPDHSGRKQAGIPEANSLSLDATLARGTSSDSELELPAPHTPYGGAGSPRRASGQGLALTFNNRVVVMATSLPPEGAAERTHCSGVGLPGLCLFLRDTFKRLPSSRGGLCARAGESPRRLTPAPQTAGRGAGAAQRGERSKRPLAPRAAASHAGLRRSQRDSVRARRRVPDPSGARPPPANACLGLGPAAAGKALGIPRSRAGREGTTNRSIKMRSYEAALQFSF